MGQYCSVKNVQERLQGKVKFNEPGGTDPNKMTLDLLNQLISEGESQLEIDLMDRYDLPFKRWDDAPFSQLFPSTLFMIKNLAEMISVIRVLETDFGRGTSVNADKYTEKLQKRYDGVIDMLMEKQEETKNTSRQWKRRPLDGLKVAYNNQGDNGFRGRAFNTSKRHDSADYAQHQQNHPDLNIWNGVGLGREDGDGDGR
jgi:hypothetical protein